MLTHIYLIQKLYKAYEDKILSAKNTLGKYKIFW